jgi:7,8-dihydropterin-6-yl-methyl-4-(beta-D-ribofuranosyl)aminobenzene 5'-phosphate synthase
MAQPSAPAEVHALRITILDTPLTGGSGIGEWGFSALVVADGHRILYDTGQRSDVVLRNAKELKIDLGAIPDVVLSHNHPDHVGGLLALRQSVLAKSPDALARAHVGLGIFTPRRTISPPVDWNPMTLIKGEYEKTGGVFVVHDRPVELYPGVWLTGPVPRKYEPCGSKGPGEKIPPGYDVIPEDMALVCNTSQGLVVMTGCGHAGIVNIIAYAQAFIRPARVHAIIGGLHLDASMEPAPATLTWTSAQLKAFGVDYIMGAHCTDIGNILRFRQDLGLDSDHAKVGKVRSSFVLGQGIDSGW